MSSAEYYFRRMVTIQRNAARLPLKWLGRLLATSALGLLLPTQSIVVAQIGRSDTPPPTPPPTTTPSPAGTPPGKPRPTPSPPRFIKTPSGVMMPLGRSAEFYFEEGNELFNKEDFVSARMFFEQGGKVVRKSPLSEVLNRRREAAARMATGTQLEQQGSFSEALSEYDKVLALEPSNPLAKKHAGRALKALGTTAVANQDWAAAIAALDRSRELAPDSATDDALVSALLGLAQQQSDPSQAQETYQRILSIAPSNSEARSGLRRTEAVARARRAETAFQAGRYNEARSEYEAALSLDPGNADAAAGKAKTEAYLTRLAADAAYNQRDFRTAYANYEKFNTFAPGDPQVADRLDELSVRLEPALPLRGSLTYKLKTASPFRIRLQRDQVTSALLDSEQPIEPEVKLQGRLPAQDALFRLGKSSPNVTVRITTTPSAANDYTAELVATPKNPRSEDVTVVAEWALPAKGILQWKKQLEPGAYRVYWQGPYFEVFDPTGVRIESGVQSRLPRQPLVVKVKPVKGVTFQIVEQPKPENDFTFALNVSVPSPTNLLLDLSWAVGGK
ncbi:MAG: tetratricopeptide repeat protein [Chloracidobacterium sp.]